MNNISELNSLLNDINGRPRSRQQGNLQSSSVEYSSRSFSFSQNNEGSSAQLTEVSFSYEGVFAAQRRGAHKVLGQSVETHFAKLNLSTPAAPAFEPPDPQEVANRVLGFVENRLQAEADAGASPEKLTELLGQARAGVEKGFSQARDDIEQLGLMNDGLDKEIDQSFSLINDGLDQLEQRFLGGESVDQADEELAESGADDEIVEAGSGSAAVNSSAQPAESQSSNSVSYQESLIDFRSSLSQRSERNSGVRDASSDRSEAPRARAERGGLERISGLQENAAIEIRTQDGDIVSISLQQLSASYESARYVDGPGNLGLSRESQSLFAGDYQMNVRGSLDQGEISALNDLLVQIQDLADQFFNGDFEAAYNAALDIGFDDSEIASFAVDLSQTQVEQVTTYQFKPEVSHSQAFQPLASAADGLSQALDRAQLFDEGVSLMKQLLDRMLADQQAAKQQDAGVESDAAANSATPLDRIQSFVDGVLEKLNA